MKIRIKKAGNDRFELDRSGSVSLHFRNCVPYYSTDSQRLGVKEEGSCHKLTELFEPSRFEIEGKRYDETPALAQALLGVIHHKGEAFEKTIERVDRFEKEVGPEIQQALDLGKGLADMKTRLDQQRHYLYFHRENQDKDLAPHEYHEEAITFELKVRSALKLPTEQAWASLLTVKTNNDLSAAPSCQMALLHGGAFFRVSSMAERWDRPETSKWLEWKKIF